jgi:glycerophosphoryl diester phosphodiesterase
MAASPAQVACLRLGVPVPVLARRLARACVRCAQIPVNLAVPAVLRRARAAGLQVHVWTINDRAIMTGLLDRGVDGIMTDQTELLRDLLAARGQWHPAPA